MLDVRIVESVVAYVDQLVRQGRAAEAASIEHYARLLARFGSDLHRPYAVRIDRENGIHELRAGNHRVAYVRRGETYFLLHAWRKTTRKLDQKQLKRAQRALDRLTTD